MITWILYILYLFSILFLKSYRFRPKNKECSLPPHSSLNGFIGQKNQGWLILGKYRSVTVRNLNYLITAEIVTKIFYVILCCIKRREIYMAMCCVCVCCEYVCVYSYVVVVSDGWVCCLSSCVCTRIYLNKKKRERDVCDHK